MINILCSFLTITAFVLLILGLINPNISLFWLKINRTRKKSTIIYLLAFLVFGIAGTSTEDNSAIENPKQVVAEKVESKVVFDIPSLIGKDINEVMSILGTPTDTLQPTKLQIEVGVDEWDCSYEKKGYYLLVTYYIATNKVKDFFLSVNPGSGNLDISKDYKPLLEIGNLDETSTDKYFIKPVQTRVEKQYTGIIITNSQYQ